MEMPRQTGHTKPSSESKEEPRTDFNAHAHLERKIGSDKESVILFSNSSLDIESRRSKAAITNYSPPAYKEAI
jgi:hypothetical protein